MGRTSVTTCQLDNPSARANRSRCWISSTAMMMTNRMGATRVEPCVSQTMACSTTPRLTAATKMSGRLVMRPITHAASERTRIAGPSTLPRESPSAPARRNTATKASTAAMVHTTSCTRLTGMPSSTARSALSALARTAMPRLVKRKNAARAALQTTTAITAMTWLALKMMGEISKESSKGAGKVCGGVGSSNVPGNALWASRGKARPRATRSCARPRVATVRMRRGALAKRRMMPNCTSAPSPTASSSPRTNAIGYGMPTLTMSSTAAMDGTSPRSPWAKLTMRLAR